MAELCDTCGKADSNGTPCYLMFRPNTDIQRCTGHEDNPKKHAKLVKAVKKEDPGSGGK